MKICYIITALGYGGAERLLVKVCNALIDKHHIEVIYLKDEKPLAASFDNRVKLTHIAINGLATVSRLRKYIKETQPNVVHTHLGHADLLGFLACRSLKLKCFCTLHNVYYKWNRTDEVIFTTYKLLLATVARRWTVIGVSKAISWHARQRLGVLAKHSLTIYNGIESKLTAPDQTAARKQLQISTTSFVVLFVGRLEVQKSVHTLIEAAAILKNKSFDFKIYIVGTGSFWRQN